MDRSEKLEETKLTLNSVFYSKLNMKDIDDQDCQHAHKVWNTMEKKTQVATPTPTWKQMFYC